MNNWNFTGNLGKEAEQRFTSDGKSIVSFSVAVKSGYGDKASTTWANCAVFGKQGEGVFPYLTKGQQVGITGEVTLRPWKDKEGNERQSLDVRVVDLTLLGSKGRDDGATKERANPQERSTPSDFTGIENDLPF